MNFALRLSATGAPPSRSVAPSIGDSLRRARSDETDDGPRSTSAMNPRMSLVDRNIPGSVLELIPEAIVRENGIIPIDCTTDSVIIACPAEGFTASDREAIEFLLNRPIFWESHPQDEILLAINRHYGISAGVDHCGWQFKFQCPRRWRYFSATDDEKVRFCPVCSRNVYLCVNDAEVVRHAQLGHCIAKIGGADEEIGLIDFDDILPE